MSKYPDHSTPCLTASNWGTCNSLHDDNTADFTYTTEFKAALRNAAPRRRISTARKQQESVIADHAIAARNLSSLQSKDQADHWSSANRLTIQHQPSTKRGFSQTPTDRVDNESAGDRPHCRASAREDNSQIHKRPRRRTFYIPPNDTTISTIQTGLRFDSTRLSGGLQQSEQPESEFWPNFKMSHIGKKGAKRASLAAAPKRAPLLPTLKPLQEMDDDRQPNGPVIGKENVPPDFSLDLQEKGHREPHSQARRVSTFHRVPDHSPRLSGSCGHRVTQAGVDASYTNARIIHHSRRPSSPDHLEDRGINGNRRASIINLRNSIYYGTGRKTPTFWDSTYRQAAPQIPFPATVVHQGRMSANVHHQIFSEDIERPEMFEESWLSCQEFAVQQLLNRFFDTASEKVGDIQLDRHELRVKLLHLYQGFEGAIVFKRLNASLLYGALNPPKGSSADIHRLQTDVGLRQAFVELWLSSYDLDALTSVAEVIVGRNILPSLSPASKLPRKQHNSIKERTRSTGIFIELCLLRNEDAQGLFEIPTSLWFWRRTMLRSLMMVLLLDRAKECGMLLRNLFKPSSRFKTSHGILVELCSLVSPFLGDVIRSLAHLHYQVHHVQHPLSEYNYGIRNLATNLRDGVQLTRLVELLLDLPGSSIASNEDVAAAILPDEVSTTSQDTRHRWLLSQHLKIPCVTWSQKVHNVQLALSALSGLCSLDKFFEGVKAEDIVDGHREKTVTLLWGLVAKFGLEQMIDFDQVRRETRRLSKKSVCGEGSENGSPPFSEGLELVEHTNLLREWAQSVARLKGLSVSNLTTSFSDGKVFAAIVDEYQRYLPDACLSGRQPGGQLATRLKEIGCSDAFANIFAYNEHGRVFHRDFTISALAFLCSRLLGASKRGIAASVILQAYRRAKIRECVRRRCALLRLAHDCRSVYFARNKVIDAARILQRNWRGYLCQKQHGSKLEQRRSITGEQRSKVGRQVTEKNEYQMDI